MPLKTIKKEAADALTLEWVLAVKNYKLILDRNRCVGCQICTKACPKEAIKTEKQSNAPGERVKKAKVDIDLAKCNFCGVCDLTCPYGAIEVTLNGSHDLSILAKDSYPKLVKDITVNSRKCDKECVECEKACPLSLIKISRIGFDGKPVQDFSALSPGSKNRVQVNVDIQKEYCPTCKVCEYKCSQGALKVNNTFEGSINIKTEKCPEGCTDCKDVCPIPQALTVEADNKVHVNQLYCTYCGACKNVCPVNDALSVKRTKVSHTPIRSGTWNKTLERITSPADATKELEAQAAQSRRLAVEKRFLAESLKK